MNDRPIYVTFVSKELEETFEKLQKGTTEKKQLYKLINRAISDLKKNPMCGIKIPKKLWPKGYIKKYQIDNLWKYDLPNAWRLIYTIAADEIRVLGIILEWLPHKKYEQRFRY